MEKNDKKSCFGESLTQIDFENERISGFDIKGAGYNVGTIEIRFKSGILISLKACLDDNVPKISCEVDRYKD